VRCCAVTIALPPLTVTVIWICSCSATPCIGTAASTPALAKRNWMSPGGTPANVKWPELSIGAVISVPSTVTAMPGDSVALSMVTTPLTVAPDETEGAASGEGDIGECVASLESLQPADISAATAITTNENP
jgi:hypothetical protein